MVESISFQRGCSVVVQIPFNFYLAFLHSIMYFISVFCKQMYGMYENESKRAIIWAIFFLFGELKATSSDYTDYSRTFMSVDGF